MKSPNAKAQGCPSRKKNWKSTKHGKTNAPSNTGHGAKGKRPRSSQRDCWYDNLANDYTERQ